MMIVLTYDVSLTTEGGQRRLRKVSKLCERYGVRVQNSVFELLVDSGQLTTVQKALSKIIDHQQDSIRFYRLGNSYENKIECMGKPLFIQQGEPLIL
ncbi:MAG: CRISPR-associated endonuclease Cas2 [Angelakisella sp.]|nr:CRISPR-associated endonuclease Cas2 [Angelakisella sp.]